MSLKRTLGLAGFNISDEEILVKMDQAHRLGKDFIEFVNEAKTVRVHIHGCEPYRNFDSSDRAWLAN